MLLHLVLWTRLNEIFESGYKSGKKEREWERDEGGVRNWVC